MPVTIRKDAAYYKALERRKALADEMAEIDLFLSLYRKYSGDAPTGMTESPFSGERGEKPAEEGGGKWVEVVAQPEGEQGFRISQDEFEGLAAELLCVNARPLSANGLLDALHRSGRRLGGKDEMRNLTTKLWRARDKIIKIPGAGYWLKNVACPAVRYEPFSIQEATRLVTGAPAADLLSSRREVEPAR